MRILENDKRGTEVILDKQEQRNLRRVTRFLASLARHTGGEQEKAAAESIAPVASKWAPEPKTEEKTSGK